MLLPPLTLSALQYPVSSFPYVGSPLFEILAWNLFSDWTLTDTVLGKEWFPENKVTLRMESGIGLLTSLILDSDDFMPPSNAFSTQQLL